MVEGSLKLLGDIQTREITPDLLCSWIKATENPTPKTKEKLLPGTVLNFSS